MDLNQLRRSVDLMAGAVRTVVRPAPAPAWAEWATVVDPAAPSITLDSDWDQTPRPVLNAAGRLAAGNRVLVLHQGTTLTIITCPAQETAEAWTPGAPASGFSGDVLVRRIGPTVELSVSVSGTIPTGTTAVAIIPGAFCPSASSGVTLPRLAARLSAGHAGVANVGTSGSVSIENQTGSSRTAALVRGTWLIG